MTDTRGSNISLVLLDSDGLIASFKPDDVLHARARRVVDFLSDNDIPVAITTTTIAEVVTTIDRRFKNRNLASKLYHKLVSGWAQIIPIDEEVIRRAYAIYSSSHSPKNTIFDAINVSVAKKHAIHAIFSFDGWYKKQGLHLIGELMEK